MAGGHIREGEKQLCQVEVDGCPSQMDGDTGPCIAFLHHRTFLCRVVVIHQLLDCQQKRLQKIPLYWTARVHFVHINEPLTPVWKCCPLGSGQKIISCEVFL